MASLGTAFVSVRADTDKFPDDVRRAMRRLDQQTRQDSDKAGEQVGQRLGTRVSQSMNRRLRDMKVDVRTDLNAASVAATEAGLRRVTRDREVDVRINRRGLGGLGSALGGAGSFLGAFSVNALRILGDFFNFGRQIGQIFGEVFKTFQKGGGSVASLAAGFAQLAAAVVALIAVLGLLIGIFGVLLALASALYQAILLVAVILPGLGLIFLAAIGPLVLVFSNLGEALKATGGDLDDFNDKIKDFGSNTQDTLRGVRDLVGFFQRIRQTVQESFFEPISQALSEMRDDLGPTFEAGFIRVADAAGTFVGNFLALFEHPNTQRFFDNIFRLADLGFEQIGDAGINLVAAFANLVDELFPETEEAIQGIADVIDGWAESINEFANDPALDQKLETWKESFNTIVELIGTAVELAQALLNGFQEDGIPILERLNTMMEEFITYLESPEGEEFFDGLRIAAMFFLFVLQVLFGQLQDILELVGGIGELFEGDLTDAVDTFSNTWLGVVLFGWLIIVKNVADEIADIILGWKDDIGAAVGPLGTVGDRLDAIRELGRRIAEWFTRARGVVVQIATSAISAAQKFQPFLNAARGIRDAFSSALGFVQSIATAVANISFGGFLSGFLGGIFGAEGGIFTKPTSKIIGEAGPEVLIPLSKPERAMQLVRESGLMDVIRGGDGASAASASSMAMAREMQLRAQMTAGAGGELVIRGDGTLFARAVQEAVMVGMRTNPAFARKVRAG